MDFIDKMSKIIKQNIDYVALYYTKYSNLITNFEFINIRVLDILLYSFSWIISKLVHALPP